jgi:hypothetical protein
MRRRPRRLWAHLFEEVRCNSTIAVGYRWIKRAISATDTGISKSYLCLPLRGPISPPSQCALRRFAGKRNAKRNKGDRYAQIDICIGHARSVGNRVIAHRNAARRSGQRMRSRRISGTGRRLSSLRERTVSRRLLRTISQCLPLERLSSRLLAGTVGSLPRYGVSRPPTRRWLEVVKHRRRARGPPSHDGRAAGRRLQFKIPIA